MLRLKSNSKEDWWRVEESAVMPGRVISESVKMFDYDTAWGIYSLPPPPLSLFVCLVRMQVYSYRTFHLKTGKQRNYKNSGGKARYCYLCFD